MPYNIDANGFASYSDENTYLSAAPIVPSPRHSPYHSPHHSPYHSPVPSPHGSPNISPMYLDENYNYYQPNTGYVGVPMMPTGFVPLPPSPSSYPGMFVPLTPSPRNSPQHPSVALPPGGAAAYPQYQQCSNWTHRYRWLRRELRSCNICRQRQWCSRWGTNDKLSPRIADIYRRKA